MENINNDVKKEDSIKQQEKIINDAKINKKNKHYVIGEQLREIYTDIETITINLSKTNLRKLYILEDNILEATKHAYQANFFEENDRKILEIDYARANLELCDNILYEIMANKILPKKKVNTVSYKVTLAKNGLKNYKLSIMKYNNKQESKINIDSEFDINTKNEVSAVKKSNSNANENLLSEKRKINRKSKEEQEKINNELDALKDLL